MAWSMGFICQRMRPGRRERGPGSNAEAHEELGLSLDLSVSPVSLSITFNRGYDDIFILQSDVDISSLLLQEDEVADVKWAKKEEILNLLAEKKFVPFFPAFIETLFAYKDYGDIHS